VAEDSFFLIDEMLRGTNSVDKYLGSRAIIKKLIEMGGKGMVATHDPQLATLEEEYVDYIKNFHFDIQVKEGEMLFDYKLKSGRCTVFNASLWLNGIGIDVNDAYRITYRRVRWSLQPMQWIGSIYHKTGSYSQV